jgi:ribosomal protein S18 acetylase RimI-like enzyme
MKIEKAALEDIDLLLELGKTTFTQTFAANNTPENMAAYMNRAFTNEKLKSELENPHSEFYLVRIDEKAVGYLKVNTANAQTEQQPNDTLEIERIYVLNDFYGQGIGLKLLEKAITIAREKRLKSIWLGVWERNHRALRFYEKNGFQVFDKHIFKMGTDDQTDLMMRLTLK